MTAFDRARSRTGRAARLASERGACVALAGLLGLVFLGGGGSRGDIASLLVLRPVSVLACGYGWLALRAQGKPVIDRASALLLGLLALALLQLVPLPPAAWQALPGRALHAEIAAQTGMAGLWRPLTLSPAGTRNMIFALATPLAVLWLFRASGQDHRRTLLAGLLLAGLASILLSFAQLAGSARGPFYLYRVTSEGYAVGLFANRNHNAVFLAALIPLLACLPGGLAGRMKQPLALGLAAGGVMAAVLVVVLSGSRAGLACLLVALPAAMLVLRLALGPDRAAPRWRKLAWLAPLPVAAIALLATFATGRAMAVDRWLGQDGLGHRGAILPSVLDMLAAHFPAGAGFGSFAQVYPRYEPLTTMQPLYLNHAHNDWLQWVIEGGLPALALLAVALVPLARLAWRRLSDRQASGAQWCRDAACCALLAILGLASLVDYPLRTPAMMALAALAVAALAAPRSPSLTEGPRP